MKKITDNFLYGLAAVIVSGTVGATGAVVSTPVSASGPQVVEAVKEVKRLKSDVAKLDTQTKVNKTRIEAVESDLKQIKTDTREITNTLGDLRELLAGMKPAVDQINELKTDIREIRNRATP